MSTQLHPIQRITIYTATGLTTALLKGFNDLGAKGYTIVESRGKGDQGTVDDPFTLSTHVRIEVLVQPAVAQKITNYVASLIAQRQSITFTLEEVKVINPDHF